MGRTSVLTTLLALSVINVATGQYYDVLQGLQQLFQPYQSPDFLNQYNVPTRSPQTYNIQSNRKQGNQRQTQAPSSQYEYTFATTEYPIIIKKNSSHSNLNSRNLSNKNQNSNILLSDIYPYVTTKAPKLWGKPITTENYNNNFYYNDVRTTDNIFGSDFIRPVTENVFDPKPANLIYESHNFETNYPNNGNRVIQYNNRNNNNKNRGILNTDYNSDYSSTINRNPESYSNNRGNSNRRNNNNSNNNRNTNYNGYLNTDNQNYNRPNNKVPTTFEIPDYNNQGANRGDNYNPNNNYPSDNNPLINRPGVKPAPVNDDLPPITNRPVFNTNNGVNRPTESSYQADAEPEILIGPDEDDMSDREKRRFEDITERMCERYKALTVKKIVALPLIPSPDPVEVNVSDCTPINVPLIIGGKVVSIREFPHMALIGWQKLKNTGYSWKCGGSLISDQYVLTAGHCTYQDKDYDVVSGPPQAVQLGSSYLDDPGALVVKVLAVIRHPKYKQRRAYHDIALIKLANKVKFSEVIRPACLGEPPPEGKSIIATGWGRTEFGGDHSFVLRSVSLPVWNMEECRDVWGTSLKLPNGVTADSHICAGEKAGGKDTCQGDSGGPVQLQSGCVWRVIGVTSYGRSCGAPHTPALYARLPRAFIGAQLYGENYQ
ncbi:unnamed protein product [Spodoptera littoralis]|uniref:Peptidase S1 domain-containing protein n=1 Tax=Spodoptera littoralis TaxID=7109 RepID=A0A9P0N510_SPOLI|nr:unnamed protein product [Spodoptera littoralis]CAH1642678.1 unnamed protein product [Spodoptera littoralis]